MCKHGPYHLLKQKTKQKLIVKLYIYTQITVINTITLYPVSLSAGVNI